MATKDDNSFYKQSTILAAASVFTRIIGLIFKVPLSRIIGDSGLGVYSNAYEIYSIALLISTYGIPVAVSKLVSYRESVKQYKNSFRIFKTALVFSAVIGLIVTVVVFFGSGFIATQIFRSSLTAIPLRMLAPTILVFAVMGVFRGFYQGKNTVIPTSISQIIEQIVHVIVALVCASAFMKSYTDVAIASAHGAAGGTFGTFVGAVASLVFLVVVYYLYRPSLIKRVGRDRTGNIIEYPEAFKILILTLLPIILNQFLYSVTGTIDAVILNNILAKKGIMEPVRDILLGKYSGKFKTLVNVPLGIASAIGAAILPNIVIAYAKGSKRELNRKIYQIIKLNMMIAIPCALGLISLSGPIMQILFKDSSEMSRNLMVIGGMSVVFFAYATTSNSILQGMSMLRYPVIHAFIGIVIYILIDFPLLTYTHLGVYVLAISYMVFPLVIGILNSLAITRKVNYRQELLKTFILPFAFSLVMGIAAYFSYKGVLFITKSGVVSLCISIVLAAIVYFGMMIFTHTLSRDEILDLPMGGRIINVLGKIGIGI